MNNSRIFSSLLVILVFPFLVQAQTHKGISFQGMIKLPTQETPTRAGITVNARILSPNDCILREEQFTGVNISNGYINLALGTGTPGGNDPGLTLKQVMDNSATISGLVCLNLDGTVNGTTSYNPASGNGARKFRMSLTIDSTPIVADFNMRSMAFAINAESLDGKAKTDFVNINSGSGVTQFNAESIFSRFAKLDAILNNFNAGGSALTGSVSGTAANVTGTVAVANGGTGATTAAAARTNLGLAPIASSGSASDLSTGTVPTARLGTGTADGTTYLRGDGTWATPAGGGSGDITDVTAGTGLSGGGTSGAVTLNLSNVGTAGDYYKVTTDAQGRVTAGQAALVAADIPSLATSKITSGTFADAMLAGISVDKILNGASKYFNYKPANTACADNEVLKYDSTLNAAAGGWKCAADSGVGAETDPSVSAFAKTTVSTGLVVNGSNQLEVDVGTTGSKIVQLTGGKLPAVDGSNLTNLPAGANFSGSLSGDVTGTQGATVVSRLNGISVSTAVAGDDTKFMKYVHGSGWQPHVVKLSELKNGTGTASAFNAGIAGCTAAQTLTWSSVTDQMNCQAINGIPAANVTGLGALATKGAVDVTTADVTGVMPISKGGTGAATVGQNLVFVGPTSGTGAPSFRALTAADLPASSGFWVAATGGINYAGGKVGIGTTTPNFNLSINGTATTADRKIGINDTQVVYLPDQTPFMGSLFVGNGGASLSHPSGVDGYANTGVGIGAFSAVTTGFYNTGVGYQALNALTTGNLNTAMGYFALKANTTGATNVAYGAASLSGNTSGAYNVAVGNSALSGNTTGNYNTALGIGALTSNSGKNESTAIGYQSMQNADNAAGSVTTYNTAVGANSLQGSGTVASNTGIKNTAMGHSALQGMSSGTNNIGLGWSAGSAITTASNNVVIGSNTGSTLSGNNNILIADGAGTERVRILSTGNFGIGTSTPAQKLEVAGSVNVGSQATRTTASTNRGQLALGSSFQKTSAGSTTLDANDGNVQEVVNFLCNNSNTITFSNMRDGGVYTLLLSGAVAHTEKCLFAHAGLTFKTSGGNVAPTASRDVLFTFAVIGTTVIYSMVDNLQ